MQPRQAEAVSSKWLKTGVLSVSLAGLGSIATDALGSVLSTTSAERTTMSGAIDGWTRIARFT